MTVLDFALWNTKLAPPSCEPLETNDHLNVVRQVLSALLDDGCGLLALVEVRRRCVLEWLPDDVRSRWACIRDTSGKTHDFDIALLYDERIAIEVRHEFVETTYASSRVRCGLVSLLCLADGTKLLVVVAHWRSDIGGSVEGSARRLVAATALKNAIANNLQKSGQSTHVLVLGDFNVEPYDSALTVLPTARFREVVRRHVADTWDDLLLYNTSWRWLGESQPWCGETVCSAAGTYFSGKRNQFAWRTVDQVLVSASLLGNDGWTLLEGETKVWLKAPAFDTATGRLQKPLDHLPIVGRLSLLPKNEE